MCRITIGVIVAALMTISAANTEEQTTMWHALPQPKARPTPTYTARQPVEWSLFNPGAWGPIAHSGTLRGNPICRSCR